MKIVRAEFIKSCREPEQWPSGRLPEVAIAGRSNVGKSSLINSLLNRKGLAKVSAVPGKTRILNFFQITVTDPQVCSFRVVDLPGYGYAKVAKSIQAQWGPMIERYVADRAELRGVLLLVDVRGIEHRDRVTVEWLRGLKRPTVVVATKADKLSRGARFGALQALRDALDLPATTPLIPYSSTTQEGREELWGVLRGLLLPARSSAPDLPPRI